jgi:hypothetical protein
MPERGSLLTLDELDVARYVPRQSPELVEAGLRSRSAGQS